MGSKIALVMSFTGEACPWHVLPTPTYTDRYPAGDHFMHLLRCFLSMGLLLAANIGFAQDGIPWVQSTNRADDELVQEISRKLDQQSPVRGSDEVMPLKQLTSLYPIAVLIDEKALEAENMTKDEPITIPVVPGISIRNQLKWILAPLQLTYLESPGYLTITSKKMSANVVRLYDVTEFVSDTKGNYNFEALFRVIEESIVPDNWINSGGTSNMIEWRNPQSAFLVVTAPDETHEAICDLFESHRELIRRSIANARVGRLSTGQIRSSTIRRSSLR